MDKKTRETFTRNQLRREHAAREVDRARQELERLLVANRRRCSVVEMARAAGVSRETAYVLMRRREAK